MNFRELQGRVRKAKEPFRIDDEMRKAFWDGTRQMCLDKSDRSWVLVGRAEPYKCSRPYDHSGPHMATQSSFRILLDVWGIELSLGWYAVVEEEEGGGECTL